MWTRYHVTWNGLNDLCASVPADPEIVKKWLDARMPENKPPGAKSIDEVQEEVFASLTGDFDRTGCNILTFQRHKGSCVMRAATIKAHLKDCARRISEYTGKLVGEKSFAVKVINGVYPDPLIYWAPILRPDGTPVVTHDGERDKAIHTWRGAALKRFEWIEPWRLDFTLQVLTPAPDKPVVHLKDLHRLMDYGGVHGYAGERGDGSGKYTFTIEEVQ